MKKNLSLLAVSLILLMTISSWIQAAEIPPRLKKAAESIDPLLAYQLTRTMASEEFAGRLTGHEGYTRAARWAASKFKEWGLKPLDSKNGYLQPYPSPYTVVDKASMTLHLPGKPDSEGKLQYEKVELKPEKDFLPLLYADSGEHTAGLVFAGWGISAPELNYDDYAGIEVKGKFILCFRGTPDPTRREFQHHDEHRTRMRVARERGALGVIYIYPEAQANPNGDWQPGFMPGMITEKTADLIFKEINSTTGELKKALQTYRRPISFELKSRLSYSVSSRHFPDGIGYNIAGWVEGSDPKLKKELIVVGGHFDHCGQHLGLLFPGADDNASGSAVVMVLARAFASLNPKPKRSIMFVLFGGEELGLQGSTYFVEHLPAGFEKVTAMFNFDMEGEGDGAWCGVSAEPAHLKEAIERANQEVNIIRGFGVIRSVGVRGSDFAPFFLKGIPCASFGSNGPHLAYHGTGDTIYRINPEIMGSIAKVAFLSIYFLAQK
ncbi:MAG: M20/M25/M40 family metallo-hydrolase [Candidatus Saccharicenans sp.]|nr:M20/M25/M40 family metallo-hydrolase [Candidatus Saccharicenans sp.]